MNIMHNKTVKFITQLCDAMENDATQANKVPVSKYQLISRPKLDTFQLHAQRINLRICCTWFCCKLSQLHICQILFKL